MIHFEPTTTADYDEYMAGSVAAYAADHVQAGRWTAAESLDQARREMQKLLPQDSPPPITPFIPSSMRRASVLASSGFICRVRVYDGAHGSTRSRFSPHSDGEAMAR